MFIMGRLLEALATVVYLVLNLYMWVVIIRALISWVNPDPYNPIVRFLYAVTDPILNAIRRRLPVVFSGIDFSPLLLILAIYFLQIFLVQSMRDLAYQLIR
ncbi:YggT family protein [Thermodesulforhabdus norvegica]|uniref:YggT family protein n=1 Tax=Thermodesulforhabdus norvegica TaxID=39841 RepID=A0A1I4SCK1_9BACT|nr:YggT family protein [Thermodesulforhabdus norvegica]SFM62197.1 YggT family protein [Thermodesulforhabdus norvegica]